MATAPEVPFWTPSEAEMKNAAMTKFRLFVNERYNLSLAGYWDLWKWSTGSPKEMNEFWTAVWDYTNVVGDKGSSPVSSREPRRVSIIDCMHRRIWYLAMVLHTCLTMYDMYACGVRSRHIAFATISHHGPSRHCITIPQIP